MGSLADRSRSHHHLGQRGCQDGRKPNEPDWLAGKRRKAEVMSRAEPSPRVGRMRLKSGKSVHFAAARAYDVAPTVRSHGTSARG